jgi:hypothetical protein
MKGEEELECKAYVLIETAVGKGLEVRWALGKCDWIESVQRIMGPFDVIAIASGESVCDIDDRVKGQRETLDGIVRMVVCPIVAGG